MTAIVVVGLQWGDEGKGKTVDFLADSADVVVRFQGGANAAHTVVVNGENFVFRMIPTGALRPGKALVIADGVAVDPGVLLHQIELLVSRGVKELNLLVSQNAKVIMPYHLWADGISEGLRVGGPIGTTQSGVGPAYIDHVARQGVRMFEFIDPEFMRSRFLSRVSLPLSPSQLLARIPSYVVLYTNTMPEYEQMASALRDYVTDTVSYIQRALAEGKTVLFEGAQGTMLDIIYGTYPHVTSSSTLAGSVCVGGGVGPTQITEVVGVVKAYSTRISKGALPTEVLDIERDYFVEQGQEFRHGSTLPQRCGWLDLVALNYAAKLNGVTSLAVTKLDVLDQLPEIKVCVEYERNGKRISHFPASSEYLNECRPIYEVLPGWQMSTSTIRCFDDLPRQAKSYIRRIETCAEVPVRIVSVGPDRSQTVVCD